MLENSSTVISNDFSVKPKTSSVVSTEDSNTSSKYLDTLKKRLCLSTGLVYDVRLIYHDQLVERRQDVHPENPLRIFRIFKALETSGCLGKMKRIPLREADDYELRYFHTQEHIDFMDSIQKKAKTELINLTRESDSVYFNSLTSFCSRLSCGGVIELLKEITLQNVKNGLAVVRPPGHHAVHDQPMGFCFFNNVAVAVKKMIRKYGVKKVLILDWDVHHGNGIQDAFYEDPNVLYISIHRFTENFYPGSGDVSEVGEVDGIGRNVNIPFTNIGMGDNDYMYAFQHVVMPIALEFNPELVVVAAGFDAAMSDPIGDFNVSPLGYAHMTHYLKGLAEGRLAICLEGGYSLDAISKSALAVARVLLGTQPEPIGPLSPSKEGAADVLNVIKAQSKYWKCLKSFSNSLGI